MLFEFGKTTIRVNTPDYSALLSEVSSRLRARRGFALATLNLYQLVKLRQLEAYRQAYSVHDIVVADGNPIVWLSWLARKPVSLVPGSDLVLPLSRLAAETGGQVALVGANDATLEVARQRLMAEVPGLTICYYRAPQMGFDPDGAEAAEILGELARRDVALCFLALGTPRQECFSARGRSLAPDVGFACLGAGLDFIAGTQHRAPAWIRRLAMEWLWRAMTSPRRMIPRYFACAAILPSQIIAALEQR